MLEFGCANINMYIFLLKLQTNLFEYWSRRYNLRFSPLEFIKHLRNHPFGGDGYEHTIYIVFGHLSRPVLLQVLLCPHLFCLSSAFLVWLFSLSSESFLFPSNLSFSSFLGILHALHCQMSVKHSTAEL